MNRSDARRDAVSDTRFDRPVAVAIAAALAILGFLPVPNWIPGGEVDRLYALRFIEWGYGTFICLGVAAVAVLLLRHRVNAAAPERSVTNGHTRRWWPYAVITLTALALYAWIARSVFSARPLLIDEIVQLFQARIFATGHLWLPVAAHREFFSILHVVDTGDKVYSQFPPGGPAMLALGDVFHAAWLVGPVCGALSVALFSRLVRFTDPDSSPHFHLAVTALFAVTPFGAFMFGSHMNHVTTLMWLLVSMVALGHMTDDRRDVHGQSDGPAATGRNSAAWAFVNGFGLGAASTIRPLDAFAFALPAAVWLLYRALRDRRRWWDVIASGGGVAIPFAAMLWINAKSTGSPLLFGYEVLWGKAHGLGFHAAPWGARHTPQRGLELISLYVTRLQTYLFETPFPSLVPVIASFALTRRLSALDRYLLASSVFLGSLYFAYWHDGFYLGPRFVFPWLPVLVLFAARLPHLTEEWFGRGPVWIGTWAGLGTGAVLALTSSLPIRVAQYRNGLTSMRVDYAAEAARAGVANALVFVRESWGEQIVTRMWALGVSRSAAAALYRDADACALDEAIRGLERDGVTGTAAEQRLAPLRLDSAKVISSPFSPDSTERLLPGALYDRTCATRINEDRTGYTHLAPLLLERRSGNVYARDLQARDSFMLTAYPRRPVYMLRRGGTEADAAYLWVSLSRDSVMASWRSAGR